MYKCKDWLILLCITLFLSQACKKSDPLAGDLEPGIALTFDDASLAKWTELLPMFDKYGVHATFFICTACTDGPLDKSKILQLYNANNEIAAHSHHHLNAAVYIKSHTPDEYYRNEITPCLQYFDSLNIPVTSFAYPGGDHTDLLDSYLSNHFSKIRALGLLRLAKYDSYVFHKRQQLVYGAFIDRASPHSLEEYKHAILLAKSHRAVLLLVGHSPGTDSANLWSFSPALLDSICSYTVQQKLKFYRMHDL